MVAMPDNPHPSTEAPHFTREWLIDALRYVRRDFEAASSGEAGVSGVAADDARARSRMEAARRMELDALAEEATAAIDRAVEEAARLEWPGGLEVRYTALLGALKTLAQASSALNAHTPERPPPYLPRRDDGARRACRREPRPQAQGGAAARAVRHRGPVAHLGAGTPSGSPSRPSPEARAPSSCA